MRALARVGLSLLFATALLAVAPHAAETPVAATTETPVSAKPYSRVSAETPMAVAAETPVAMGTPVAVLAEPPVAGTAPVVAAAETPVAATAVSAPASVEARRGVLLLAHGGRAAWNDRVTSLASQVRAKMPVEVAFGMASRPAIQAAIDRLVAAGVTEIVAVPLFVSDHSSVVTSTAYLLGQRTDMPEDLKMFATMDHGSHGAAPAPAATAPATPATAANAPAATTSGSSTGTAVSSAASPAAGGQQGGHAGHGGAAAPDGTTPVTSPVPIAMTPALGRHPIVADILTTRARSISTKPAEEALILVAHGPVEDEENRRWVEDMTSLAGRVRDAVPFASVDALTVRDDAPPTIRDAATADLRTLVQRRAGEGRRVLIVPLLMSYGGIEGGIRKRLDGLTYAMPEQGLTPDDRLVTWVLESAAGASVSRPSASR